VPDVPCPPEIATPVAPTPIDADPPLPNNPVDAIVPPPPPLHVNSDEPNVVDPPDVPPDPFAPPAPPPPPPTISTTRYLAFVGTVYVPDPLVYTVIDGTDGYELIHAEPFQTKTFPVD
jgi:hypothetical protein